jgi:hypothetical protein
MEGTARLIYQGALAGQLLFSCGVLAGAFLLKCNRRVRLLNFAYCQMMQPNEALTWFTTSRRLPIQLNQSSQNSFSLVRGSCRQMRANSRLTP